MKKFCFELIHRSRSSEHSRRAWISRTRARSALNQAASSPRHAHLIDAETERGDGGGAAEGGVGGGSESEREKEGERERHALL